MGISGKKSVESRGESRIPVWVVLICLAPLVFGIGGRSLWTPDEPREAAIASAMAKSSSWLLPRLAGEPFVEKPPLYYWLSAGMMNTLGSLTGPTTAARSLSALSAALTLLILWLVAKRYLGKNQTLAAVLILATSYGFFYAAHWIIIDPLLMFLVSAAVLFLFAGLDQDHTLYFLAGSLAGGLAFLTKGFVAWGLFFFPLLILAFLYYPFLRKRPVLILVGILLFLGPPLIWMFAFHARVSPDLWREWFIDNQIGRFLGKSQHLGHLKGPFYYLWLFPLIILPWTPVLIGGLARRGWRDWPDKSKNFLRVTSTWALGGLLILTLSGTKREVYLYPLLPAFALLLASVLEKLSVWERVAEKSLAFIFTVPLVVFSFLQLNWNGQKVLLNFGIQFPVLICAAVAIFALIHFKDRITPLISVTAATFYLGAVFTAFPILDQVWSYEPMTRRLAEAISPAQRNRVCVWRTDETTQAVFFYYRGLIVPVVRDPERMIRILKGKDKDFDLVIIPRVKEFKRAGVEWPPWQILARGRKGPRRVFYLITGNRSGDQRTR